MKTFIFIVLFGITIFTVGGDTWWSRWMALEYVGAVALGALLIEKYSFLIGACVTWTLFTGIMIFGNQSNVIGATGPQVMAIENVALKATVAFLILVGTFAYLPKKLYVHFEDWFATVCFVDSIYVIYQTIIHVAPDWRGGFIGNPSMNACFIAATYPFLAFRPEPIPYASKAIKFLTKNDWVQFFLDLLCVSLPIAAVFGSASSIPIGALCTVFITRILFEKIDRYDVLRLTPLRRLITALGIGFVFGAAGYFLVPMFFFSSGRFAIWQGSLKWFFTYADRWIGAGNGEYFLIGGVVQKMYSLGLGENTPWFGWAHNDWLQTFIEQGYIGLTFYVLLFLDATRRLIKKKETYMLSALVAYGGIAFFNFPVHNAPFAILGMFLVAKIFGKDERQTP